MLNTLNFMVSWRDGEVGRRWKSAVVVGGGSFTCEHLKNVMLYMNTLYSILYTLWRVGVVIKRTWSAVVGWGSFRCEERMPDFMSYYAAPASRLDFGPRKLTLCQTLQTRIWAGFWPQKIDLRLYVMNCRLRYILVCSVWHAVFGKHAFFSFQN